MHGILSDFIYGSNSNILSFSDGITIPHVMPLNNVDSFFTVR